MNLDHIATEWYTARNLIADFLACVNPALTQDEREALAGALIARLANHVPAIVLEFQGSASASAGMEVRDDRE